MGRPAILLADDQKLVLDALKMLLEPEFDVVGTVSDGRSLLPSAPTAKPDVIVLDIGMTRLNGPEAGLKLKRLLPRTKLIVLTVNEDPGVASNALRHWASGYLLKKSSASELVKAIREALRGKSYVTPKIARRLEDEFVRDPKHDHKNRLTFRQREVLQLLAEGRTMKETAEALHITPRTVAFHKYKIMQDFGFKNNSELVRFAISERVISPA